jgi:surface antigen
MPVGRSTFTKRQKEQNRLQKRQEKAERKKQRALEKGISGPEIDWEGAASQLDPEQTDPEGQSE